MPQPIGLVADVGRNSVTFALTGGSAGPTPREIVRYPARDHTTFTGALMEYVRSVKQADVALHSVLAIAGSAGGDVVNLTGSRWFISLSGVASVLRQPPIAINECAATALAITTLPKTRYRVPVGFAVPALSNDGTCLVISPETGLGVAALLPVGGRLLPVESEAAHMNFAPQTDRERQLAEALAVGGHPASNEAVLSAAGLVAAYRLHGKRADIGPEDITRLARHDPAADAAVALFAGALGSVVSDLTLAFGAWNGVFLTGSIVNAIAPYLDRPEFRRRIAEKRAFRSRLAKLPLAIVSEAGLPLLGACVRFAAIDPE